MSMMIGHKGVKYGLTIPKQKFQQKQAPKVSHNVFAQQDSDDDQDNSVGHQVARQAATKQSDAKVAQVHRAALQEDPSIFDYDSHVDTIHQQRTAPKQEEKLARKSRYIQGLLDKSKEREREQDIIYERRLLKEREVEDHLFGDKDKFVTAAYKKKLEEDQKWLAEQAVKDKQDEQDDVRKRGHMMDFHRNHFRNVALGGPPPSSTTPAATAAAASAPAAAASDSAQAGPSERQATGAVQPADASWEAARAARERFERAQQSAQQSGAAEPSQEPSQQQHDIPTADSRQPSGSSIKPEHAAASFNGSTLHDSSGRPSHAAVAGAAAAAADERSPQDAAGGADTGQVGSKADGEADTQPAGGAKRTTEDAAAAARERYLARKRKAS